LTDRYAGSNARSPSHRGRGRLYALSIQGIDEIKELSKISRKKGETALIL